MSTMENFYTIITSTNNPVDAYFEALISLMTMQLETIISCVGDLGWQEWGVGDSFSRRIIA